MNNSNQEGRVSTICSSIVLPLYRMVESKGLRSLLRSLVLRLEGGALYSCTIREIYRRFHGVSVGLYTIGPCTTPPGNLAFGTTVGRYSSVYYTVRTVAQDFPMSASFPDGLCSDSALGETNGAVPSANLVIGNDVFIGHNAIILPSVKQIGDGAVIGAGSVVHADVPPYGIATGNPARIVRFRFSEPKIAELCESKWWLKSIEELSGETEEFRKPLEGGVIR